MIFFFGTRGYAAGTDRAAGLRDLISLITTSVFTTSVFTTSVGTDRAAGLRDLISLVVLIIFITYHFDSYSYLLFWHTRACGGYWSCCWTTWLNITYYFDYFYILIIILTYYFDTRGYAADTDRAAGLRDHYNITIDSIMIIINPKP